MSFNSFGLPQPTLDPTDLLPAWAKALDSPLRDAWLAAWEAMCTEAWNSFADVLQAQQSPRYAEGTWLTYWGQIMRRPPAPGESETDYRARLLQAVDVVTPEALLTIIDYIVGLFGNFPFGVVEPAVDCARCTTDAVTPLFASYAQPDTTRLLMTLPAGATLSQQIAGMYTQPIAATPLFELFLPFNANDQTVAAHAQQLSDSHQTANDYVQFAYCTVAVDSLFAQLYNEIEARRGGGVSWSAYVDPYLRSAK